MIFLSLSFFTWYQTHFPLYYYENSNKQDNITDYISNYIKEKYNRKDITREDIFYYVYGITNSIEYKTNYKNDLFREDTRIPIVKNINDFILITRNR